MLPAHASRPCRRADVWVKIDGHPTTLGVEWDKSFSNDVGVWTMNSAFHHPGLEPEYGAISWDLPAGYHT